MSLMPPLRATSPRPSPVVAEHDRLESWEITDVRSGRGFSQTIRGSRRLSNGRYLCKSVMYPSPFDAIAYPDRPSEIEEHVRTWTGVSGESNRPADVPGATLILIDFDGEEDWWADFGADEEAAQAYALSLPALEA